MNRKTLIFCIILVAVLVAGAAFGVYYLYYGEKGGTVAEHPVELSDSKCGFFGAVPTDADAVLYFSGTGAAVSMFTGDEPAIPLVAEGPFRTFLSSLGSLGSDGDGLQTIISCHYVGGLETLFVCDVCPSEAETPAVAEIMRSYAERAGLYAKLVDCSTLAPEGTYLRGRKILLASTSDVLMESSYRHIGKGVSVLDRPNFTSALSSVSSDRNFLLISNENASKLMDELFNREYRAYNDAIKALADWCAFTIDGGSGSLTMSGAAFPTSGADRFVNIFSLVQPSNITALSQIPSYAVCAFALPLDNVRKYVNAYADYLSTKSGRVKYNAQQQRLKKEAGVDPIVWAETLNIKEVAVASYYVGDNVEKVVLFHMDNASAIDKYFSGTAASGSGGGSSASADNLSDSPAADAYMYKGFTAFLFGSLFSAGDEAEYMVMDDWVIVGSGAALREYRSGRALENSLGATLSGAGVSPNLKNQFFLAYFAPVGDERTVARVFKPKYAEGVRKAYESSAFCPALLTVGYAKGQTKISFRMDKADFVREHAPEIEGEVKINVDNSGFSVKNSGTGKMNTFYQRENNYLCLNDENGRGLWGAPFSAPICGRAGTIDYFENGKLQILFASGSKLYLIDRLGRFVNPFPISLKKEVLLGPDIYDFNGKRKYNVLVLNTDNTIDMYNLKGEMPADWKGITFSETIVNLPEMVKVGGRTYWVVRTSLQSLIYPFYGGEPLTTFKGNDKIRPDSKITPVEGGVKAVNYSGKEIVINLNAK